MPIQKNFSFSSDGSFFAYINEKENMLIYETASNELIDCNFVRNVNTCNCICWIPMQPKYNKTKSKVSHEEISEETLLATGSMKGDVLIYNVKTKNLFLHLTGRHNGAINDMCLYTKNNYFFTCSNDQHIAIWDISTGKQISKWKTEEKPSSICVIDEENLLSSCTVILWWSISKKTVLKKFSEHMTAVIKLLPVNVDSVKSYFLSVAVDDTKIKAWSLTSSECQASVAEFALPHPPVDMDISKASSKDKPLMLAAVAKDGNLHIFEHALNGSMSEFVQPKVSTEIDPECGNTSVLSVKLTENADGCIVAYETSDSTIAFKHVKLKELLQKSEKKSNVSVNCESSLKLSLMNDSNNAEKDPPVNGFKDSVLLKYKSKLRSSMKTSTVPDLPNPNGKDVLTSQLTVNQEIDLDNPKSAVDALLEAIEICNHSVIEAIFKNDDAEFVSSVVQTLPTSCLKVLLNEINNRLLQRYSVTLCKWLKEILKVHLRYLIQCNDAVELLQQTRKHLSSMNISETLQKMTVVQGLLNLQTQDFSSDETDSDDLEPMEL